MWADGRRRRYERGVARRCPGCFGPVTRAPGVSPGASLLVAGVALRSGPTLAVMVRDVEPPSQERARGASLGLPTDGPGSLASFGTRVLAYFVDAIAGAFGARPLTPSKPPAGGG